MPPATAYSRSFAPVYACSTWLTTWEAMRAMAAARVPSAPVPPLTNAEAAAFVREWRDASGSRGSLWAQFAAQAYGWNPPARTYLRRDKAQAAGAYALDDLADVWKWSRGIATELDARGDKTPRIAIDRDTFSDPVFAGSVRAALRDDGHDAKFKIPMPACRDKSGRARAPLPPCDRNGRGLLVGHKGKNPIYAPCDKPGDCEPVEVDDPVTYAGNQLATLLLWAGVAWFVFTPRRVRKGER